MCDRKPAWIRYLVAFSTENRWPLFLKMLQAPPAVADANAKKNDAALEARRRFLDRP
jgi:hypothetical protein